MNFPAVITLTGDVVLAAAEVVDFPEGIFPAATLERCNDRSGIAGFAADSAGVERAIAGRTDRFIDA